MLLSLQPRGEASRAMLWCSPLLAALLTLLSGALLFALLGHPPLETLKVLLVDPLGDLYGVSELLVKALPILLCALGLAVVYNARIWNIGAEGRCSSVPWPVARWPSTSSTGTRAGRWC